MPRSSRPSRQSVASTLVHTLEHDVVAVALQEELGARVLLIRTIGEGGMGRVYLARDPQLKRFVAVKVLVQKHGADPELHARFQREAQSIAAVSHPNVVQIYGVGELPDGAPYFIMQYVSGGSMSERLAASGPLPVDVAEIVIGDVAAALAAAHRRGIVHRDVKPANVLWDQDGERATVSDFGIAGLQPVEGDENDIRITGSGMAVGSPAYMSPEQLLTEAVTTKSDVYALGLLGYELLTGRGPYDAVTPSDVVAAHLRDKPRRLSEVRRDIPESLQELLLRCLEKEPADRPTAEEVMLAMTPGAADALEWPPPGLERLRAALWRVMLMPTISTVILLLPLVLLVKLDRTTADNNSLVAPLLLAASTLLGFAAFLRGAQRLLMFGRILVRATRLGYGWGTLLEVMADRRLDTGSLIAGTREYSGLDIKERATFRVLRVVQAITLFAVAPLALIAAIIALALRGGEARGGTLFASAFLTTLLVVGAVGVVAGMYEQLRLSKTRRKRAERPHRTNEDEFAPAWYAAFERSREGQSFGPGPPVSRVGIVTLVSVGALIVLFCAAAILTASVITVEGQIASSRLDAFSYPRLVSMARTATGGRSYRLPPDGNTTPVEAGDALLAISSTAYKRKPSSLERPVSNDYPPWRRVLPSRELFPAIKGVSWTTAAVIAAGKGLTVAQRDVLTRAAAHPAREEFSRAALAAAADPYGALLALPFKERVNLFNFPSLPLYGLFGAAESHAALAALDVADHRPLDAERHAREIISVGSLVLDMHQAQDINIGLQILDRGVRTLEAVYVATGREREARVLLDSVAAASSRANQKQLIPGTKAFQYAIRDTTLLRGARMETLFPLMLRVCADPKQLLFGTDDHYRRDITYARDSLARFPSERAWIAALDATLNQGVASWGSIEYSGALMTLARTIDGVVGGKRFESCAALSTLSL